ncbi:hypothetical protein K5X82_01985 [Halosquirtibacter xylanolyticus]|uniref:hypothetical protein n=1 Tax=Halosquirtibacter xylanolyticus TaxID=3374599 RepID=UPI0037489B3C|nr:hypothetical protein K5X82_01985 [Prolixibacteraceae bacterium]
MIAAVIGRTFLQAYNTHYRKDYDAKTFFDQVFFPLFFDHPKYMQWVTNSPFVQMKKGQKVDKLTSDDRLEKLEDFHVKVQDGVRDASMVIGGSASESKEFASTSGQVTDLSMEMDSEELYLSWIGGGFGVGVAGGLSIFFDHSDLLMALFEGWQVYRQFLNHSSISSLRGNQINTWNGQWLSYYCRQYKEIKEVDFHQFSGHCRIVEKSGVLEVSTIQWNQLLFSMSKKWATPMMMGYVYSLGQTNTTMGFYPFQISACRGLRKFYQTLFGENHAIEDAAFYETLYGLHIKRACEKGAVGLVSLQPKDLDKYMKDRTKKVRLSRPKLGSDEEKNQKALAKDRENIITYRAYKTWILAMITKNKEEMLDYTSSIAKCLMAYRDGGAKGSKKRPNQIELDLLGTKSKKGFIMALTDILKEINEEDQTLIKGLRDRVHLMGSEDFGYFQVLLKFDYAYAERENC